MYIYILGGRRGASAIGTRCQIGVWQALTVANGGRASALPASSFVFVFSFREATKTGQGKIIRCIIAVQRFCPGHVDQTSTSQGRRNSNSRFLLLLSSLFFPQRGFTLTFSPSSFFFFLLSPFTPYWLPVVFEGGRKRERVVMGAEKSHDAIKDNEREKREEKDRKYILYIT